LRLGIDGRGPQAPKRRSYCTASRTARKLERIGGRWKLQWTGNGHRRHLRAVFCFSAPSPRHRRRKAFRRPEIEKTGGFQITGSDTHGKAQPLLGLPRPARPFPALTFRPSLSPTAGALTNFQPEAHQPTTGQSNSPSPHSLSTETATKSGDNQGSPDEPAARYPRIHNRRRQHSPERPCRNRHHPFCSAL